MKPKNIFTPGMLQNPKSWDHYYWIEHFQSLGYEAEAPAWPLRTGEPAELRANMPAGLGSLTLKQVYEHADDEPHEMTPELFHKNFANTLTREQSPIVPLA